MSKVFNHVFPYVTYIPSYALQWGFVMATWNPGNLDITGEEIDNRINSKITGALRFYDSITHHALFNLPKYLRSDIKKQTRIISDKDPLMQNITLAFHNINELDKIFYLPLCNLKAGNTIHFPSEFCNLYQHHFIFVF